MWMGREGRDGGGGMRTQREGQNHPTGAGASECGLVGGGGGWKHLQRGARPRVEHLQPRVLAHVQPLLLVVVRHAVGPRLELARHADHGARGAPPDGARKRAEARRRVGHVVPAKDHHAAAARVAHEELVISGRETRRPLQPPRRVALTATVAAATGATAATTLATAAAAVAEAERVPAPRALREAAPHALVRQPEHRRRLVAAARPLQGQRRRGRERGGGGWGRRRGG